MCREENCFNAVEFAEEMRVGAMPAQEMEQIAVKVSSSTLPAIEMIDCTTLMGKALLSNMRQVLGISFVIKPSCSHTVQCWKHNIPSRYFLPP